MEKQLHGLDLLQNPHKSKKTNKFFKINHGLQSTSDKSTNTEIFHDSKKRLYIDEFKDSIKKAIYDFDPEQYHLQINNPYYMFLFSYYQLYITQKKSSPEHV